MTDERLLLSCCSDVAEWLVTAEESDSTVVTVPNGAFHSEQVFFVVAASLEGRPETDTLLLLSCCYLLLHIS